MGERSLQNHNKLLWRVEGADGVKTGYTKAAGRILVSSACREGRRLICVTINDGNDWADHASLLETGFSRYRVRKLVSEGECLGWCEIAGGAAGQVELLAGADFCFSLTEEETPRIVLPVQEFAYAPVAEGEAAGFAYICIGQKPVGKVPLVYGQTVEQKQEPQKKPFWKEWFGVNT